MQIKYGNRSKIEWIFSQPIWYNKCIVKIKVVVVMKKRITRKMRRELKNAVNPLEELLIIIK